MLCSARGKPALALARARAFCCVRLDYDDAPLAASFGQQLVDVTDGQIWDALRTMRAEAPRGGPMTASPELTIETAKAPGQVPSVECE